MLMSLFGIGAMAQNSASKCYRGFVDAGYTVGIGDYEFGRVELSTSHGYQFNPYVFLGAGVGLHFMQKYETNGMEIALDTRDSKVDVPVFGNVRFNFAKSKIAPFVDGKVGYYVTNNGGLYYNVSAGCRFSINAKQAVSVSVGYTSQELEFETFDSFSSKYNLDYTRSPRKLTAEGVAIKVGFEF